MRGYRLSVDALSSLRDLIGRAVHLSQDGVAEVAGQVTGAGADIYYSVAKVRLTFEVFEDDFELSVTTDAHLGTVTSFLTDHSPFQLPPGTPPVLIEWDEAPAATAPPGHRSRRSSFAEQVATS